MPVVHLFFPFCKMPDINQIHPLHGTYRLYDRKIRQRLTTARTLVC